MTFADIRRSVGVLWPNDEKLSCLLETLPWRAISERHVALIPLTDDRAHSSSVTIFVALRCFDGRCADLGKLLHSWIAVGAPAHFRSRRQQSAKDLFGGHDVLQWFLWV